MSVEGGWMSAAPRLVEGRRLKDLFERLPRSFGVFKSSTLTLTCVDAQCELLAIGCNAGTVFIYEKSSKRTGMLPEEGRSNCVSCVRLCESIRGVAYGCVSGVLVICEVHIQKEERKAPMKMLRLSKDHSSVITGLSWLKNGNCLISGDAEGKIVIITVDFIQNVYTIRRLHQTDSPIVQLSAGIAKDWIAVSTSTKSFLLTSDHCSDRQPVPIGQKDRKIGPFGACLWHSDQEVLVYVARPGLRLWKASLHGKVLATLQYRSLLTSDESSPIQMDSVCFTRDQKCIDEQFQSLHLFAGRYIVTHSENNLWVLDPENSTVLGCHGNLGKILDVAATMTEIYVLREEAECPILMIKFYSRPLPVRQYAAQREHTVVIQEATSTIDTACADLNKLLNDNQTDMMTLTDQTIVDRKKPLFDCDLIHQHQQLAADELKHSELAVVHNFPSQVSKVAIADDERVHQQEGMMQNYDTLHEQALKLERFERATNAPFSDEIVYDPKKEKRKKNVPKKKSLKTSDLSLSNDTNERSMAIADTNTLASVTTEVVSLSTEIFSNGDGCQQLEIQENEIVVTTDNDEDPPSSVLGVGSSESGQRDQNIQHYDVDVADCLKSNSAENIKIPENMVDMNHSECVSTNSVIYSRDSVTDRTDVNELNENDDDDDKDKSSSPDDVDKTTSTFFVHQADGTNLKNDSPCDESGWPKEEQASHSVEEIPKTLDGATITSKALGNTETSVVGQFSYLEQATCMAADNGSDGYMSIYDKFMWDESVSVSKHQNDDEDSERHKTFPEQNNSSLSLSSHNAISLSLSHSATMVDQLVMDEWRLYQLPSEKKKINCVALSNTHVFVVDDSGDSFMAEVGGIKAKWEKIAGEPKLNLISVSPNQLHIVGVSIKNSLYLRVGVTNHLEMGKKWSKISDGISYVAVEDNQMWGLQRDGTAVYSDVIPAREGQKIEWDCLKDSESQFLSFVQVTACNGVVWARNKQGLVYYRYGISSRQLQGTKWLAVNDSLDMIHICAGGHQTCLSIHHDGSLLFMKGMTADSPSSKSRDLSWWKVGRPDCYDEAPSSRMLPFSLFKSDKPSSTVVASNSDKGVCICTGSINLYWSNSALLGSRYETVSLQGIPQSASHWLCVAAGSLSSPESGLVWTVRRNGEIFCLSPTGRPFSVDPPSSTKLTLLTVSETAVWCLIGDIVILRNGINSKCPEGVSWKRADTTTVSSPLRWLSCGRCTVWAVDKVGRVWLREAVDLTQQSEPCLPWMLIQGVHEGRPLHRVVVSSDDSMVWAIDIEGFVYVRTGLSERKLAGEDWECVGGPKLKELAISKTSVWAISTSGNILCKLGVTLVKYSGDNWKKVVGLPFNRISVTQFDQLWGIDCDGQIFTRYTTLYNS